MILTTLSPARPTSNPLPSAGATTPMDKPLDGFAGTAPPPEPAPPRTTLANKLACGAVIGSGLWLGANIALQATATGSIPGAVGVVAGSLAAMAAGHVAADLTSGVFHHWIDNYPTYKTPIVGDLAYEFQVHHHRVQDLQEVTVWDNMAEAGRYMWVPMAAVAATAPHWAAQAFTLGFTGGAFIAQGSHRWSHQQKPPALARLLQKLHVTQTKEDHAIHHRMPWADNYCIVNGMWNPLMTRTHFFRKWEKLIYQVTGREPHCWQDPGVKAFALGQISEEQFFKDQGINRQIFHKIVKGRFDAEYERRQALRADTAQAREAAIEARTAKPGDQV